MYPTHTSSRMFQVGSQVTVRPTKAGEWQVPVPSDAHRVRVSVQDAGESFTYEAPDGNGNVRAFSVPNTLPDMVTMTWRDGDNVIREAVFTQADVADPTNMLACTYIR